MPAAAVPPFTVSVEAVVGITVEGEKEAVAPDGTPDTEKATPSIGSPSMYVAVTVYAAVPPIGMVLEEGVAERE